MFISRALNFLCKFLLYVIAFHIGGILAVLTDSFKEGQNLYRWIFFLIVTGILLFATYMKTDSKIREFEDKK